MFNFNFDKKAIIVIIAIMLVTWIVSSGADGILGTLLSLPGVIIAMTFHEYAHALAAYKLRR